MAMPGYPAKDDRRTGQTTAELKMEARGTGNWK